MLFTNLFYTEKYKLAKNTGLSAFFENGSFSLVLSLWYVKDFHLIPKQLPSHKQN